jgi:hypothetical protein
MSLSQAEAWTSRHCEPGAWAFHVNSGERWIVTKRLQDGRLRVISSRGVERTISPAYWLGEAFADD